MVLLLTTALSWTAAAATKAASFNSNNSEEGAVQKLSAVVSSPAAYGAEADRGQQREQRQGSRVLNVHVVPHTHDDVGWRKTVEQYYHGWNETIDSRGAVNEILSTAVEALLENAARTFAYAEIKFFSMWWREQSEAVRDSVRYLIANDQWTFVNGGWCMHDEASSHYVGMIDQTALGHAFLRRELGVTPRTAWQLDPFGHSFTQASLLTAAAGMDAIYFGRIDYQDRSRRRNASECEGLWRTSPAAKTTAAASGGGDDGDSSSERGGNSIFWGLTGSYRGNYGPPPGFCFDVLCDNEPLFGTNSTRLLERVNDFLREIQLQSSETKGNHILITMGTDFTVRDKPTHSRTACLPACLPWLAGWQHEIPSYLYVSSLV
jgi:alpha-mannosidase